jgi:hypothetical protein
MFFCFFMFYVIEPHKKIYFNERSRKTLKIWGKTPKKGLRALKIKINTFDLKFYSNTHKHS